MVSFIEGSILIVVQSRYCSGGPPRLPKNPVRHPLKTRLNSLLSSIPGFLALRLNLVPKGSFENIPLTSEMFSPSLPLYSAAKRYTTRLTLSVYLENATNWHRREFSACPIVQTQNVLERILFAYSRSHAVIILNYLTIYCILKSPDAAEILTAVI